MRRALHAGSSLKKAAPCLCLPWDEAHGIPALGRSCITATGSSASSLTSLLRNLATARPATCFRQSSGENADAVRHHPGQLAHFVVCFSLARTWMELGLQPDLLIGHSLGEHVAAVIGGVMTLADGIKAVEARGRLFDSETPRGAMRGRRQHRRTPATVCVRHEPVRRRGEWARSNRCQRYGEAVSQVQEAMAAGGETLFASEDLRYARAFAAAAIHARVVPSRTGAIDLLGADHSHRFDAHGQACD